MLTQLSVRSTLWFGSERCNRFTNLTFAHSSCLGAGLAIPPLRNFKQAGGNFDIVLGYPMPTPYGFVSVLSLYGYPMPTNLVRTLFHKVVLFFLFCLAQSSSFSCFQIDTVQVLFIVLWCSYVWMCFFLFVFLEQRRNEMFPSPGKNTK